MKRMIRQLSLMLSPYTSGPAVPAEILLAATNSARGRRTCDRIAAYGSRVQLRLAQKSPRPRYDLWVLSSKGTGAMPAQVSAGQRWPTDENAMRRITSCFDPVRLEPLYPQQLGRREFVLGTFRASGFNA